ncbi:MAG: hypothetical protein ABIE92_00455 [bacterium]
MPNYQVTFKPNDLSVAAAEMASLLEVARKAGFVLSAECGGQGDLSSLQGKAAVRWPVHRWRAESFGCGKSW